MVNIININKDLIALSGLVSFVIISGLFLSSSLASADDSTVATASVTVPASCTMSGTGMNSHTAEIPNGTYQANIGTTTLHAFCNDANGFAIYAAGYTGNEIGGTNSNKLVGTAATSNATIVTGLATSAGNPDVSNWAMKLAIQSDSGNTTGTNAVTIDSDTEGSFASYHTVPNEYKKVAHKNTATDMTASTGGVKLTTTYAAYISKTQPADTYTGQVIYTLVHPTNHAAPVVYNTKADDISEVTYLQEFAKVSDANRQSIVDSMVPEQQYTLTDTRDNKTYTIAKYQTKYEEYDETIDDYIEKTAYDVWMTQNLDLDLDTSTTYTNEDTDIGYNTTTNTYDTASWTPMRSTYQPTSTQTHEWCAGGTRNSQLGFCENNDTPESYDPGSLYWNLTESDYSDWGEYLGSCDYSTSTPTCDQSKNPISTYVSSTGTAQYHLGNYYNWAAALATNDSSMYVDEEYTGEVLVEQSICPAGWTLSRVGEGEDTFYSLWNQYGFGSSSISGSNKLWASPLYFAASGSFDGGLGGVGLGGYFWAPVPVGSVVARGAYFDVDGGAGPSDSDDRSYGGSVRCILRPVVNADFDDGGGGEVIPGNPNVPIV